jgi:iron complex transport system ATP-binding protein
MKAPVASTLPGRGDARSHAEAGERDIGERSTCDKASADARPLASAHALGLRAGGEASGRVLFFDLDFAVRAGERWVVLGPNGAGKSSLLGALAGVFPIAAGRVAADGVELAQWRGDALAAHRAWCPQFWSDPFPASVLETVQLARHRERPWRAPPPGLEPAVQAVLAELELTDLAEADVRTLSGGERQRVAIATALLQDAPLLLFDEPASHLDLGHQAMLVARLVRHAAGGGAVMACLHDLNLAWDLATHAVLLDGRGGGRAGTRDDVMTAAALGAAFGVALEAVDVGGRMRYFSGAGAKGGA